MLQADEPRKHYAEGKKADTKEHILYDRIYMKHRKLRYMYTENRMEWLAEWLKW
jgi:hypothetical protein